MEETWLTRVHDALENLRAEAAYLEGVSCQVRGIGLDRLADNLYTAAMSITDQAATIRGEIHEMIDAEYKASINTTFSTLNALLSRCTKEEATNV